MELKFLPNLSRFVAGRGRGSSDTNNPVAHAITGTAGALSGPYGTVFDPARAGWDIEEAVRKGIERVIWVFRCVDVIAGNQAWLPIIQRRDDPLNGEIIDKSEYPQLFKMLNRRTNSYEDSFMFRYRLSAIALLSKRGVFIEVVRDKNSGEIVQAHILPPGQVEPIPDRKKFVAGYRLTTVDRTEQFIPPERVLWLRLKPHPIDPYAQMTPLMAAGLAAETDWLARQFNRSFLVNDGRPGLLVGIRGRMGMTDAKEIKDRFRGGVDRAGTTTVVEADGIDVMDLGASPREVQWLEGIRGSKEDLLLAFGVAESVMGNASGRTFDNADAEKENFWEDTMQSHCNPLARGLDPLTGDVDDDIFMSFDYDGVDVLQRRKRAREDKWKQDYKDGLLTFDELMEKLGRKPLGVPTSRVYFHPSGLVIAQNEQDTLEVPKLPLIGGTQEPTDPSMGGGDPAEAARQGAIEGTTDGRRILDNIIGARAIQLSRVNRDVSTERALEAAPRPRGRSLLAKSLHQTSVKFARSSVESKHPYEGLRTSIEGQVETALEFWDSSETDFAVARLDHVKVRKFTRHWEGEGAGTKALDPDYVVSARWTSGLQQEMGRLLRRHARQTVKDTAREMVVSGVARAMHAKGRGDARGRTNAAKVFGSTQDADSAVDDLLKGLDDVVTKAAERQADRIKARIREMDEEGASLSEIKAEVRRMSGKGSSWRKQLATYLTTAIVEGAQHRTWERAGTLVSKVWNTQADERVRHTHAAADGQTVAVKNKFRVGKSRLGFPGDPSGDIGEIANCRCWLGYQIAEGAGRFFDEAV